MPEPTLTDVAKLQAAHVLDEIKHADTLSWAHLRWLGERLVIATRHLEAVEPAARNSRGTGS